MIQSTKWNKSLLNLALEKSAAREKKNKKVFKDGVNQRADIKQDQVIDSIVSVTHGEVQVEKRDLCKKYLYFESLNPLKSLCVSYYTRNSLFARVFDLIAETRIPASFSKFSADCENSCNSAAQNLELSLKYKGRLKTKDVSFTAVSGDETAHVLADRLNRIDLLKDRVRYLELLDFSIKYDAAASEWYIGIATGKGSAVWMLFPPMVMLTPLDKQDAIKLIELFQLVIKELVGYLH